VVEASTTATALSLPSSGIPAQGWLKYTTTSSDPRDLNFAKLATGATFEQADTYFNQFFQSGQPPAGEPPAAIADSVSSVPSGKVVYLQLDLKPANYVAVSDTDSDQDGTQQIHQEFTIS
jgi:hypothetical protein